MSSHGSIHNSRLIRASHKTFDAVLKAKNLENLRERLVNDSNRDWLSLELNSHVSHNTNLGPQSVKKSVQTHLGHDHQTNEKKMEMKRKDSADHFQKNSNGSEKGKYKKEFIMNKNKDIGQINNDINKDKTITQTIEFEMINLITKPRIESNDCEDNNNIHQSLMPESDIAALQLQEELKIDDEYNRIIHSMKFAVVFFSIAHSYGACSVFMNYFKVFCLMYYDDSIATNFAMLSTLA